jgi:tetratricopeptide (TPR) repeat protein
MSKFDRKKYREEQFQKEKEAKVVDPYENFEGTKTELLFLKTIHFILLHRVKFLLGLLSIIATIIIYVGVKEYSEYRIAQATLDIEKVEKKFTKDFSLTTPKKIEEMEALLAKHSFKDAKLRIYKRLSDLHLEAFEVSKSAEYLEKSAELITDSKELKAYYYYLAGSLRDQSNETKLAISNFDKASLLLTNARELNGLVAWTHYQAGRLKLKNGEKESAIKDLNRVLDIESDNPDIAEVKKLSTFLLLKSTKG